MTWNSLYECLLDSLIIFLKQTFFNIIWYFHVSFSHEYFSYFNTYCRFYFNPLKATRCANEVIPILLIFYFMRCYSNLLVPVTTVPGYSWYGWWIPSKLAFTFDWKLNRCTYSSISMLIISYLFSTLWLMRL